MCWTPSKPKEPKMAAIFGYNPPVIVRKYETPHIPLCPKHVPNQNDNWSVTSSFWDASSWVWDSQFLQPNTTGGHRICDTGSLSHLKMSCLHRSFLKITYLNTCTQHTHKYIHKYHLYTKYIFSPMHPAIHLSISRASWMGWRDSSHRKLVQGLPSRLGRECENLWFQS